MWGLVENINKIKCCFSAERDMGVQFGFALQRNMCIYYEYLY